MTKALKLTDFELTISLAMTPPKSQIHSDSTSQMWAKHMLIKYPNQTILSITT